jgi:hypothetical protein
MIFPLWPTTRWSFSLEESTAKEEDPHTYQGIADRYDTGPLSALAARNNVTTTEYFIRATSGDGNNRPAHGRHED